MYKIKSASKSVIVKFSKQSEVNYQTVCILNESKPSCLLPFDFQLKMFKVMMTFDANGLVKFSDIFNSQTDIATIKGLLGNIFEAVSSINSCGLDIKGLICRSDSIFVAADGSIKMAYAPAFEYDEANSLDNFIQSLLKAKNGNNAVCAMINAAYDTYTGAKTDFSVNNEGETTVLSARPVQPAAPDFSEGETTVLSPRPVQPAAPDFSEGETTVLSARPVQPAAPDFSEGETTVLSARPVQPAAPDFSEGETTVLSPRPVQPAAPDFSEGETSVLSSADSPFAPFVPQAEEPVITPCVPDAYNENETCYIDSGTDFGDSAVVHSESANIVFDDHNEVSTGDFSENETTIPHIGNPLRVDKTLIGSEGLAHAMAYSSIKANEKAADNYETVLLADESTDKTAFFIRFINSQAVYITKNYFTMGSGPDMDYMISGNSLISKFHATVVIENSKFYIIDNKSTNKLFVDGREAVPFEKNEIFTGSRVVLANEIFDFYIK